LAKNDRELRPSRVVVLGLGRFGTSLALELVHRGSEVLGVDRDPVLVQRYADDLTHAAVADTTDAEALQQLDVPDFTRALVGIGTDLEANILTTAMLIDLGIRTFGPKPPAASTDAFCSEPAPTTSCYPNLTWASGWPISSPAG
jgi:trk system potassium uptake protein TrkA